jgi:hypothetical protein
MKEEFNIVQDDLEQIFQISADVEFESNVIDFEGLKPMEAHIKKKVETVIPITHVKLGKPSKGGLF